MNVAKRFTNWSTPAKVFHCVFLVRNRSSIQNRIITWTRARIIIDALAWPLGVGKAQIIGSDNRGTSLFPHTNLFIVLKTLFCKWIPLHAVNRAGIVRISSCMIFIHLLRNLIFFALCFVLLKVIWCNWGVVVLAKEHREERMRNGACHLIKQFIALSSTLL